MQTDREKASDDLDMISDESLQQTDQQTHSDHPKCFWP